VAKVDLRLDWCSHEAAKYAVEHWHYSQTLPAFKGNYIGVWEDQKFVGCIAFAPAMNPKAGSRYGLSQYQICELNRVALGEHETEVSRILKIAFKILKAKNLGLRLLVSFADINQGHYGGIYQAGNWVYEGHTTDRRQNTSYIKNRRVYGWRSVAQILHDKGLPSTIEAAESIGFIHKNELPKHRYLYPLDSAMREQVLPLSKPYPKRALSADSGTSGDQPEGSGAIPTNALSEV